jgi:hypothetical protein
MNRRAPWTNSSGAVALTSNNALDRRAYTLVHCTTVNAIGTNLVTQRLRNQKLTRSELRGAASVVAWLGAVQSQDYAGAKWAVSQRAKGLRESDVEQAFNDGDILRTHILRPTWHFVARADIRWMTALSGPRVNAVNAHYYRKVGLDPKIFARSRAIFERALAGGAHLTRSELASALGRHRIEADGMRLAYLVMRAELDGVICSGPMRGKQFTYALIDERAPDAKRFTREEALAELARRYFSSHGPATVRDYVWWSGLTVADAKAGIACVEPCLSQEVIGDRTYWFAKSSASAPAASGTAFLLPNYDEYLIAYKDRDSVLGAAHVYAVTAGTFDAYAHPLVIHGALAGTWRRTVTTASALVSVSPYERLSRGDRQAITGAVERYAQFLSMPVEFRDAT